MTSITHGEGYLIADHRASPGVPESVLHTAGLPSFAGRGVFEAATIHCVHCGGSWIKNPERIRPRGYCRQCVKYVCDACDIAMAQSGYIHRTFEELAELVQSGRYTLAGSPSAPVLIPTTGD